MSIKYNWFKVFLFYFGESGKPIGSKYYPRQNSDHLVFFFGVTTVGSYWRLNQLWHNLNKNITFKPLTLSKFLKWAKRTILSVTKFWRASDHERIWNNITDLFGKGSIMGIVKAIIFFLKVTLKSNELGRDYHPRKIMNSFVKRGEIHIMQTRTGSNHSG